MAPFLIPQREGTTMSEDASQAAATAADDDANATLNPVFRTAPVASPPARQGTATPKPPGRQGTAQGRAGASSTGAPEELLADAVAAGEGIDPDLEPGTTEYWQARAQQWEKRAKAGGDGLRADLKAARAEAKQYAEKAKSFDAYEESQKTEQQKLADQLATAQQEARDAREDRFRLLAAAQYDLPPSLIGHLGGGTEDEITERAEAFAAAINERAEVIAAAAAQAAAAQQPRNGNGAGFRPVESLRPGALPASDNRPNDPNAWIRQALGTKR